MWTMDELVSVVQEFHSSYQPLPPEQEGFDAQYQGFTNGEGDYQQQMHRQSFAQMVNQSEPGASH